MKLVQMGHRVLTELSALTGAYRSSPYGLRILMYHAVGGRADDDRLNHYSITAKLFEKHMDLLSRTEGVFVVPLNLEACASSRTNVAITFDDGYRDNLRVAAPILVERKLPFTVFVATRFVRDRHADFLLPEEVRELADMPGVTIGAHGDSHVPLSGCDEKKLSREITDSKAYLEDLTGRSVKTMSYPHGSVDKRVQEAVRLAGYELAASSYIGMNRLGCDPYLLSRTTIFSQDGEHFFQRKLEGCWDWYGRLQRAPSGATKHNGVE